MPIRPEIHVNIKFYNQLPKDQHLPCKQMVVEWYTKQKKRGKSSSQPKAGAAVPFVPSRVSCLLFPFTDKNNSLESTSSKHNNHMKIKIANNIAKHNPQLKWYWQSSLKNPPRILGVSHENPSHIIPLRARRAFRIPIYQIKRRESDIHSTCTHDGSMGGTVYLPTWMVDICMGFHVW